MNTQQTSVENRLENLFSLAHSVSITLPSTVEIDGLADSAVLAEVYTYVLTNLSETFGGCTVTSANGAWYSNALGKLVFEEVKIATSFAERLESHEITRVLDMAEYVKSALSQESVLVTLDNKAYLV